MGQIWESYSNLPKAILYLLKGAVRVQGPGFKGLPSGKFYLRLV